MPCKAKRRSVSRDCWPESKPWNSEFRVLNRQRDNATPFQFRRRSRLGGILLGGRTHPRRPHRTARDWRRRPLPNRCPGRLRIPMPRYRLCPDLRRLRHGSNLSSTASCTTSCLSTKRRRRPRVDGREMTSAGSNTRSANRTSSRCLRRRGVKEAFATRRGWQRNTRVEIEKKRSRFGLRFFVFSRTRSQRTGERRRISPRSGTRVPRRFPDHP
jgi:hypothetical protein